MGTIRDEANVVYADGPSGSPTHPPKPDVRHLFGTIDTRVDAALAGTGEIQGEWDASSGTFPGGGTADTGAAGLVTTAGTTGGVAFRVGDRIISITTNSSTTVYAGNWLRLPGNLDPVVEAVDSGAGTANAIQVVASKPVSADGGQLVSFEVYEANTTAAVALQITDSGGAVISGLAMKTAAGTDPGVGAFSAGLRVTGRIVGAEFQLVEGARGWSPLHRLAIDGTRRVVELYDWTGGQGAKPATTGYLGPSGLTGTIGEAIDLRGPTGLSGAGSGDMLAAQYDPRAMQEDVFDLANHTFTLEIDGAVERPLIKVLSEGMVHIHDLGVPSDGSLVTTALPAVLQSGAPLWIPDRELEFPAETETTGGIAVELTKHLIVKAHPNARIKAGENLQANLLRFSVPPDGYGLPDRGLVIDWEGGNIDISLACNPTSVLWTAFKARFRPGGTGSRAAFGPYGAFVSGGRIRAGIRLVHLRKVNFYAGVHWALAGGDNFFGAGEGVEHTIIEQCHMRGSRGTAVYGLPAWEDTDPPYDYAGGKITLRDNIFDDCAGCTSLKQSVHQPTLVGNLARNSPAAWGIAGSGIHDLGSGGLIANNRAEYVTRVLGIQNARGITAYNNSLANAGALDENGAPLTILMGAGPTATVCVLEGAQHCDIEKVIFLGKSAEHSGTTFKMYSLGHYAHTDATTYPSGYVKSVHNKMKRGLAVKDMADLGSEVAGQAENNVFEENLIVGGSSLLTAIDPTSKWIAPKTGISYSYRDTSTTAHTGTTAATTVKTATIVAAEVPIGSSFRVRSVFDPAGTNGTKTIKAIVGANLITVSSQTSGEAQDGAMHLIISRVSSTGYTVEGWYGEEGGTSNVIPFNLFALSGNFAVGVEVTLGHADDTVNVYGLIIEPM
jgi:hypothetical protein